jgi:hypothetical protein
MSRYEAPRAPLTNPSQFFLEWNSELQSFSYWKKGDDQEEGKRISYPLPMRFAVLKVMNSITGYDENRRQGIYSNEVSNTSREVLRVLYRDGSPLAQGIYQQIKDYIVNAGGRYTKSIYAVTPKGVIINIRIKGSQMVNFGIIEKFGLRYEDEWIEVASFEEKVDKEGRPYTVPVFNFGHSFTVADVQLTGRSFHMVKNYFDSKSPVYDGSTTTPAAPVQSPVTMPVSSQYASYQTIDEGNDDDLPF